MEAVVYKQQLSYSYLILHLLKWQHKATLPYDSPRGHPSKDCELSRTSLTKATKLFFIKNKKEFEQSILNLVKNIISIGPHCLT